MLTWKLVLDLRTLGLRSIHGDVVNPKENMGLGGSIGVLETSGGALEFVLWSTHYGTLA